MPGFLVQLLIGIALQLIGFLLTPRPKVQQPEQTKDLDSPTAEAGRPVPVIWGEEEIRSANVLWFGEKSSQGVEVGGGGKK